MANLRTSGIDLVERDLDRIARDLHGKAIPAILNAGADELIKAWKDEIGARHHKTGEMERAVGKTDVRYDSKGASIEVYPMGTDSHRVTNAQKAFILHHGRKPTSKGTKKIEGDKFATAAEKKAKEAVIAAMRAKMNEFISGKEG